MTSEAIPHWAAKIATDISAFMPDLERFDLRWTPPEESDSGVDHIELAPSVLEVKDAGPNDGALTTYVVNHFDLLGVPLCFDKVESLSFGYQYIPVSQRPHEFCLRPSIYTSGTKNGREVTVEIHFEPFDDAAPIQSEPLFPSGSDEEG